MTDKPVKIDADGKLRFGRWKGVRLRAVPLGYLEWCVIASQDFDEATLMSLAREVHRRLKATLAAVNLGHLVADWPAGVGMGAAAAIGSHKPGVAEREAVEGPPPAPSPVGIGRGTA
jgi:hypothetical protein